MNIVWRLGVVVSAERSGTVKAVASETGGAEMPSVPGMAEVERFVSMTEGLSNVERLQLFLSATRRSARATEGEGVKSLVSRRKGNLGEPPSGGANIGSRALMLLRVLIQMEQKSS